jgi:peptidyl-prolyl cis-trans isomerase B (cyclophilin B)
MIRNWKFVTMMQQLRKWSWTLCLVVMVVGLTACISTESPSATSESMDEPTELEAAAEGTEEATAASEAVSMPTGLPVLDGVATVEMQINGGTVVIEVDGDLAPITAGNFVDLVQRGVYDGVSFHRVVKTPEPFVVQGGDPQSKDPSVSPQMLGTGSFIDPDTNEPRYIPLEIQPSDADTPIYSQTFDEARISVPPALTHMRGAVAMARSQLPDSASAQFYFALADLPFLDGSYAVFGYVTEGMDVVDNIEQGDIVDSATVVSGIENLQQPE